MARSAALRPSRWTRAPTRARPLTSRALALPAPPGADSQGRTHSWLSGGSSRPAPPGRLTRGRATRPSASGASASGSQTSAPARSCTSARYVIRRNRSCRPIHKHMHAVYITNTDQPAQRRLHLGWPDPAHGRERRRRVQVYTAGREGASRSLGRPQLH